MDEMSYNAMRLRQMSAAGKRAAAAAAAADFFITAK
jgi:hypothetical protein